MKKIAFLILLAFFFSCKKENQKTAEPIEIQKENTSVLFDSKAIAPYLKFDDELIEYNIINVKDAQKFTAEETEFPVKENDIDSEKSDALDYYLLHSFDIEAVNFKILAFNTYGENDAKVLNVQLNSYSAGEQKDALLLDCRFTFETEYYRNFTIQTDKTIAIKKIAIESLEFNDKGDIIGNKKVNDTLTEVVKYKIDPQGNFIKL